MIRVIDFETTGLPPDASVVEAACVEVSITHKLINLNTWSAVVRTDRPVTVEARAAHHISDLEIAAGMPWQQAIERLDTAAEGQLYCAHNADFEKAFFNPPGSRWIDTYKCALRLWPGAPKNTNQVLRYFLDDCDPGELGMPPHRALPDCHVTARVLIKCLEAAEIAELVGWSIEPPLLPRVPMGKHFGKPWKEVPTDYLEWAMRQDFDAGVAHTVRIEMERRRKGVAR